MLNQIKRTSISNGIVSCATLIKVLTLRNFKENNFEITPEQFVILDTLLDNNSEETLYQRQIGELIGKDRANTTRLLGILEEKGLIEKTTDSNGRQINRILITKKGIEIHDKIFPKISEIRRSYLENLEIEEIQSCLKTLNKIKENISKNTKLKT